MAEVERCFREQYPRDTFRDKNEKPTSQLIDESHLLLRDDAINKMLQLPSDENVQTSTTNFLFHYGAKVLKVLSYILCFLILLAGGVISKGTLLFMTSQIKPGIQHGYCSRTPGLSVDVKLSQDERISWIWAIFFCFLVPEGMTLFRCLRITFFRRANRAHFNLAEFCVFAFFETMHIIGLTLLVFYVLPNFEVLQGLMITNCVCLVPALLKLSSSESDVTDSYIPAWLQMFMDIFAVLAQLTGLFLWGTLLYVRSGSDDTLAKSIILPISLLLTSMGWWENYADPSSALGFVRYLGRIKKTYGQHHHRYLSCLFLTLWKVVVFFCSMIVIEHFVTGKVGDLFTKFYSGFQRHDNTIIEMNSVLGINYFLSNQQKGTSEAMSIGSVPYAAIYTFLVQSVASLLCYMAAKFASKIRIQRLSMALPLNLVVPVSITLLVTLCKLKLNNVCMFNDFIPSYLFWNCPDGSYLAGILDDDYGWLWMLWLVSQSWISKHNWTPRCIRLALTERLFVHPYYNGLLIDQSVAMNRRRDDDSEEIVWSKDEPANADEDDMEKSDAKLKGSALTGAEYPTTRVYICATMWHETKSEMATFFKSIFGLDEEYRIRKKLKSTSSLKENEDHYEMETHLFFDDAFLPGKKAKKEDQSQDQDQDQENVNDFVKSMFECVPETLRSVFVESDNEKSLKPIALSTPYGGRAEWTLPGGTKLIVHLKNKEKIRIKKRWSQVMYMYYLLRYRMSEIIQREHLPIGMDESMATKTFILALDGDIDFKPDAVRALLDSMKRNKDTAAACGRIHPVGPAGVITSYQVFEYAIGHWLQKATEHVIGCVLCSPGCFSLFRASCLNTVLNKYNADPIETEHLIQYDLGEDRWLCTLLLQEGFRIEYCANSDSYTNAPVSFAGFFNQRRRWVPSTMINIMDLLYNYKETCSCNNYISILYIGYQCMLMVGTILGPGTIFLMIVGSTSTAFHVSNTNSFIINLVPVLIFIIIGFTTQPDFQINVAMLLSSVYAIIMMAVLVATILELSVEGWESPTGIFLLMSTFTFVIAGIVHPQEFWCLPAGLIYYLTVPTMYMLLIFYCVCNMDIVKWGTRDTPEADDKKATDNKDQANAAKQNAAGSFLGFSLNQNGSQDDEGSVEFSLAGLFKIMLCVSPKPQRDTQQMLDIMQKNFDILHARLDALEGKPRYGVETKKEPQVKEKESDSADKTEESNGGWLNDLSSEIGKVGVLADSEVKFWKSLIVDEPDKGKKAKLKPITLTTEDTKKERQDLRNYRNEKAFTFFILNAIYVTVVFLLTLHKDEVSIRWPLEVQYEIDYIYDPIHKESQVTVTKHFLKLEPIGLSLVIFFSVIQVVQFIAMLFHRISTFMQTMASTTFTKKLDDTEAAKVIRKFRIVQPNEDSATTVPSQSRLKRRHSVVNLSHNIDAEQETRSQDTSFNDNYDMRVNTLKEFGDNDPSIFKSKTRMHKAMEKAEQKRRASISPSIPASLQEFND